MSKEEDSGQCSPQGNTSEVGRCLSGDDDDGGQADGDGRREANWGQDWTVPGRMAAGDGDGHAGGPRRGMALAGVTRPGDAKLSALHPIHPPENHSGSPFEIHFTRQASFRPPPDGAKAVPVALYEGMPSNEAWLHLVPSS